MAMTKFEVTIRLRTASGGADGGFALSQCVC